MKHILLVPVLLLLYWCVSVQGQDLFPEKLVVGAMVFESGSEIELVVDVRTLRTKQFTQSIKVISLAGKAIDAQRPAFATLLGNDEQRLEHGNRYKIKASLKDFYQNAIHRQIGVELIEAKKTGPAEFVTEEAERIDLADHIGETVQVFGALWSRNGMWHFKFKDSIVLADSAGRRMTFDSDRHGANVEVKGLVQKQLRLNRDDQLVPQLVIRGAKIVGKQLPQTPPPNSYRKLHLARPAKVNGVMELIGEQGQRKGTNFVPAQFESRSQKSTERNRAIIRHIVATADQPARDVVAARIENEGNAIELRLIYAGILAALNDDRGKKYIEQSINAANPEERRSALYVFAACPEWSTRKETFD